MCSSDLMTGKRVCEKLKGCGLLPVLCVLLLLLSGALIWRLYLIAVPEDAVPQKQEYTLDIDPSVLIKVYQLQDADAELVP